MIKQVMTFALLFHSGYVRDRFIARWNVQGVLPANMVRRRTPFSTILLLVCCFAALLPQLGCRAVHAVAELGIDNASVVVYRYPNPPMATVKVALRTRSKETIILDDPRNRWPTVVEVATSEGTVGVLICSLVSPEIKLAFSFDKGTQTPFSAAIANSVRVAIKERYGLGDPDIQRFNMDPIEWACSPTSDSRHRYDQIVGTSGLLPALHVARE